ncbi:MAG: DUF4332 domain-containing protein [Bacteroidales bacterium]|jgi:hypothetical protein|nr:DUF4332 domain-containing protein [Bacteroidales bacterium]
MATIHELQISLYNKLEQTTNFTYNQLKKKVVGNNLKPSEQLTKEELLMAIDYFQTKDTLPAKWDSRYRLEKYVLFNIKTIKQLLKLTEQQKLVGFSLIPIKGISRAMQTKLRNLSIYDASALLIRGKTQEKRNNIAKTFDIDVKLVNSWVKQADLWRIESMTADMAYLLVQIGVRHVEDLSKIDAEKALLIMERLVLAQPDFILLDSVRLNIMINEAIKYSVVLKPSQIETPEKEPKYLFKEENIEKIEFKSDMRIIKDGLGFLDDLPRVLPLPNYLAGVVYKRMRMEPGSTPFNDVLVEVNGIASSRADKTETDKTPSAYTDSEGKFRIILPEKLNLQEGITITVSQGSLKQKFMKNASDVIDAVPEQELVNKFDNLQSIKFFIEAKEDEFKELGKMKSDLDTVTEKLKDSNLNDKERESLKEKEFELRKKIKKLEDNCDDIEKEIENQKEEYEKVRKDIIDYDKTTNDLEKIFRNLLNKKNLTADIKTLTVIEEIFNGYPDVKKALPSVKLMGEGEKAIHLPTDTAPSRLFNYGILQRLVEPQIKGLDVKTGFNGNKRMELKQPIDVTNFKEQMYKDPDNYPQMVSLGIGYVLNMHQAWVPDGFALGSLIYSLILAPGEEQRLVVRESAQSYTISDNTEGIDSDAQTYKLSQVDDTTAAYNSALNQLSKGNSNYNSESNTNSFGGGYGGAVGFSWGGFLNLGSSHGFSGSKSKSSEIGSSSSSQSNSHNEASSAAQMFQHSIKSAADRISQSKRISMRTATSEESNSVATKIVANHNHSHAMTIQYWEVMRRFRLETCVDGVDLVLFVPLKLIRFLPQGQEYMANLSNFDRNAFKSRYNKLLFYADTLFDALPHKYRTGMNIIKRYAALPDWVIEKTGSNQRTLTLTFKCNLLEFDDITASLILKNGKGTISGNIIKPVAIELDTKIKTRIELKQEIRKKRDLLPSNIVTCNFTLPSHINNDDISFIRIDHSCEGLEYNLFQDNDSFSGAEREAYSKMMHEKYLLAKDNKDSKQDKIDIAHWESQLPEAYRAPIVTMSSQEIQREGAPVIADVNLTAGDDSLGVMLSNSNLCSSVTINIVNDTPIMRYAELQEIESLMHHVASQELFYSQIVWASLSEDERTIMLEQYNINMKFEDLPDNETNISGTVDIPLLNCVNVKKLLGFYGNCILLPFTYPKELADELGKTAADVQDALYRYHTHCFRVPTTTISLPTDGMIGEAVLGETNVSELIDLTRFWNWKDSPIDKMELTSDYLNNTDFPDGKATSNIAALDVQGTTPAATEKMVDLISALIAKQIPSSNNITGLDQLKDVLNVGAKSAAEGRKEVLDATTKLAEQSVEILKANNPMPKDDNKPKDDDKPKDDEGANANKKDTGSGDTPSK